MTVRRLRVAASDPAVAYAVTFRDLYRRVDGGEHWTLLRIPLTLPFGGQIGDVLIDARDPDVVFVAAQELWATRDGGATWQRPAGGAIALSSALAADPQDPDTLYAGGVGLFRSTDGGQTWEDLTVPTLDSGSVVVAGSQGEVWIGDSREIFRSPDGVTGWTRAPDLPQILLREIGIDPFLNRVLAATSAGVFRFFPGVSP